MKRILFVLVALIISHITMAQNIVGLWQAATPEVSSGYLETYQFYSNGSFRFNTNQSDGLRRVLSIGGKYKVLNGKLIFTVEYTIEAIGGKLERSHLTTRSDSWSLDGGQIKQLTLVKPVVEQASLQAGKKDKGVDLLLIDSQKYYKVDEDPANFE